MPKLGKVLAIDYGNVRIGIAISDENQEISFPKTAIKNTSLKAVVSQIKDLCESERVVEIVIGMPFLMSGEKSEQTVKTKEFSEILKKEIDIPVILHDERLTSVQSDVILNTLKMRGNERKNQKDIIAASLILQNYLELKSRTGKKGRQGEHII